MADVMYPHQGPAPQPATINLGATPGGAPPNMYANLLASYQQAAQNNYGQQIANQNRNKQELAAELARQQAELARKNKFWNRMGQALTGGVVNAVGQLPSMALKMGANALSPGAGQQVQTPAADPTSPSAPMAPRGYADYLAETQPGFVGPPSF